MGALDAEAKQAQWLVNPLELFRAVGADAYRVILRTSDANSSDSFNVGRDSALYEALEQKVGRAAEKANRKGLYAVVGR